VRDVGSGRNNGGKFGDVDRTANRFELAVFLKPVFQSDRIDWRWQIGEFDHRAINFAVRVVVEILGSQNLERVVDRFVVEQNRSKHALLGIEIVVEWIAILGGYAGPFRQISLFPADQYRSQLLDFVAQRAMNCPQGWERCSQVCSPGRRAPGAS